MTRLVYERVPAGGGDPLAWLGAAAADERFFWSRDGAEFAATGALVAIEHAGPARFARAARDRERLAAAIARPATDAGLPLLVGGFGFTAASAPDPAWSAFPPLRFWLPERLLWRRGDESWLAGAVRIDRHESEATTRAALRAQLAAECASPVAPPRARSGAQPTDYRIRADRSPAAFRALVAAARDVVAGGAFEKLVVARSLRVESNEPVDALALAGALRSAHPACATFVVARGSASFLGATPERLLRLAGRRVTTMALAGSAPRGRSPEEDARLGRALRESKKEQEEHAIVVRAIRAALAPVCDALDAPEAPQLSRFAGIQHLATPIEGTLAADSDLLALADQLHPTPAVAGAPRDAALAWLAAHEALVRGWYAGGVGWIDAAGGGDLAVALRSALVHGCEARLYAGAGVLAASDPHAELLETRLKLRTLLAPLLEP